MASESEQLLVETMRAGGPAAEAACAELVSRYEGRLQAYVRRRLRDAAAVEDVVQEVFIGFLRGITNYDSHRDLQTWLFTIASHKVTDLLRRQGRRPARTGTADTPDDPLDREADVRQRAASSIARGREQIELEAQVLGRALRELIRDFLRRGEYRRVMVLELLFVKSVPNWQVAEFLSLSEQQIANYRFSAVKKLTAAVEAAGLPADAFPDLNAPPPSAPDAV